MPTLPPPWLGLAAAGAMSNPIRIEMVADIVCPYCYIGLMRLQRAIAGSTTPTNVQVTFTPFILRRHLPKEGIPKEEVFRQQYGSDAHGAQVLAQVCATAADDGMEFNLTGQRAGNSEDAHRLLLWAGPRVLPLFESMGKAYNEEQFWLGDHANLMAAVRRTSGLDVDEAAAVLADPSAYADELDAGLRRAHELGVTGVPAFFVNGALLGTGALSEGALRSVIEQICAMSAE